MAARRLTEPIEPMTLGNMRANDVRLVDVHWLGSGDTTNDIATGSFPDR
jgi:hypothetical protein